MASPTNQDRDLWRKATETPDQITDEEKRAVLGLVNPATQIANAFKIRGLTPVELEYKTLTSPESLTEAECRLLQDGYHIWDHMERDANRPQGWTLQSPISDDTWSSSGYNGQTPTDGNAAISAIRGVGPPLAISASQPLTVIYMQSYKPCIAVCLNSRMYTTIA